MKKTAKEKRDAALLALHKESARNEKEQILEHLRRPPSRRTNFLRMRFPWGGSAL